MSDNRIAVITPSFERDFALCRSLNKSVVEFMPSGVQHYIVVDSRDVRLFSQLANSRTLVIAKEDVLPGGFKRLPGMNRWYSRDTLLPISGWLVQQIAKIAMAMRLDEPTLLMVDSDATFVRDVDPRIFTRDGRTRLFKSSGAIVGKTSAMEYHITWHENAARLLGIPAAPLPLDDYIGQVISWRRELVLGMCQHIESVTNASWFKSIARTLQVSEYLLYGVYVERVAQSDAIWVDENPRCNSYWHDRPVAHHEISDFVASLNPEDLALMISAHSSTDLRVRDLIIKEASGGRIA
jgi:hypothetical protein